MKLKSIRARMLASTIIGSAAFVAATSALAQDASGPVQEVVVTGSRIAGVTNLTSPSAISVASHEDIVLSKSTTVEDVLDRIPSVDFTGGISQSSNNGGNGVSNVSLRQLGPQRTLVLIDGQRLIPQGGSPDLNTVPLSMVDHIDVLKDGASSIYGADAIGGVINIITKKHAEGMTFDANFGESGKGDGQQYGINATVGVNSDKGNLLIGLGWDHRDEVDQADRDWGTRIGGSAYRSQLDTLQNENNTSQIWIGVGPGSNSTTALTCAVVSSTCSAATVAANSAKLPNTAVVGGHIKLDAGGTGWQTLVGDLDRKQIDFTGHYDVADHVTAVFEGFYTNYTSEQKLRPEPLLGDTIATTQYAGFIIPASNPYNLTGQDITAYDTPSEFGPRQYEQSSNTYRMRAGLEGQFGHDFKWEAGYVFQGNDTTQVVSNEGNWAHLAQLTGQVPCVDVPGGCTNGLPTTPINFFAGPVIFSPAQVAYATFKNTTVAHSFERYLYGDVNGTLFDLPYGPLQAAVGFESREEHLDTTPDALVSAGLGPNPTQPTSGGYDVKSVYGELRIPVINHVPFIKALTLTPSVRLDDYSNFGSKTTYKVGGEWVITDDLRVRASYSTAIRAPQVTELFGGSAISDNGASGDPCETNPANSTIVASNGNFGKGVLTAGSTCSKAVANGAAVTNFHDALDDIQNNQEQVIQGGNPNLKPETARIFTAGLILTPRWTPGLTIAVDFYQVKIANTILIGGIAGAVSPDIILNGCYGPTQNQAYCNLITRDKNGNIFTISSLNTNFGYAVNSGVDYEISYNTRAAHLHLPVPGYFNFDLAVTNQMKSIQTNPDGSTSSYNGTFNTNSEQNQPKWKGIFTADYNYGPLKFRYDLRYTMHTWDISSSSDGLHDPKSGVYGDAIPDYTYHDISVSYDLPPMFGANSARVILGVNNLFDKDPPFLTSDSVCKCNTIAGGANFDEIGRFFYSRISTKF